MRTVTRPLSLLAALTVAGGLVGCSDPSAQEVRADHRDEAATATAELEEGLAPVGDAGTLLGAAVEDSCETGQDNWKVKEDYDVRCTVRVHQAFQVTGEDFRAAADRVTATFPECPDSDAEETLREYWDGLEGESTHNFAGPYRPDYLPSYELGCGEASADGATYAVTGWATLPVDEESAQLHQRDMGLPCHSTEAAPCELTGDTAERAWGRAATHEGWVVFVTGTAEYARTG